MKQYLLTEIITKDRIVYQGLYFAPKVRSDKAIIWIHGLTGNFYGDLDIFEEIIKLGEPLGIGFASFNNRGHDMIAGLRKVDPKSPTGFTHTQGGAGYKKFEDCIYDIEAGITFLEDQGYRKIYLIGHSTGALKAGYYASKKQDKRLSGIILAGPMSDYLIEVKLNKKLSVNLRRMKHMVEKGKENYLVNNLTFFPITPKRFVSLFDKNSTEESMFDYGSEKPDVSLFQKITKPMLIVLSEKDEYADRPVIEIARFFNKHQRSKNYKLVILKNAFHGYEGKEREFAKVMVDWIKI